MGLRDGKLLIAPPEDDRLLPSALRRKRNGKILTGALEEIFGTTVEWKVDPKARDLPDAPGATAAEDDEDDAGPPLDVYAGEMEAGSPSHGPSASPAESPDDVSGPTREPENVNLFHKPRNGSASRSDGPSDETAASDKILDSLPVTRQILEHFGGTIQSVRHRSRPSTPEETPR